MKLLGLRSQTQVAEERDSRPSSRSKHRHRERSQDSGRRRSRSRSRRRSSVHQESPASSINVVLDCQINKTEGDSYSYHDPHGQRLRHENRSIKPKRRKSLSRLRLFDDDMINQYPDFESTPNTPKSGVHEYFQPQQDDNSVYAEHGTDLTNRNQLGESRWDKVQHKFHRAGSTYAMVRARELLLGEDRLPPQDPKHSSALSRSLSQPQSMRKKQVRFKLSPSIVDDLASGVNHMQIDPDVNTSTHTINRRNTFCDDQFDHHPHTYHENEVDERERRKPRRDKHANEIVKRATTESWIMNHSRPLIDEDAADCCEGSHSTRGSTVQCQRYETEVAPARRSELGARSSRCSLPHSPSQLYTESF